MALNTGKAGQTHGFTLVICYPLLDKQFHSFFLTGGLFGPTLLFKLQTTRGSVQGCVVVCCVLEFTGVMAAWCTACSGDYGPDMTLDKLVEFHRRRVQVLAAAGPDVLAFETIPSLLEAQVLLIGSTTEPSLLSYLSHSLALRTCECSIFQSGMEGLQ